MTEKYPNLRKLGRELLDRYLGVSPEIRRKTDPQVARAIRGTKITRPLLAKQREIGKEKTKDLLKKKVHQILHGREQKVVK